VCCEVYADKKETNLEGNYVKKNEGLAKFRVRRSSSLGAV